MSANAPLTSPSEGRRATHETAGIWALEGDRMTCLARADTGSAVVLVPSEEVLIVAVDLPLTSRRERVAALPFAIEDHVAEPIGELHVALGMELAARRHLAAAVRHRVMAGWIDRIAEAGLVHASVVPDALSLPVPEDGGWSVQASDGRAIVRASDGTGFATSTAQLPVIWAAAGKPLCRSYGDALSDRLSSIPGEIELEPLTARLLVPAVDLRQGLYAKPRRALPLSTRKVLAVLAAGALAHASIAIADTVALQRIAENRRLEAQALVQRHLPGVVIGDAFAAEINALLADGGGGGRSRFLPLLVKASAVLGRTGSGIGLRTLAYREATGELTLGLEQPDIGAMQRAQGALASAGLNPIGGAASVENGVAGSRIVIRDGIAGSPR